MPYLFSNTYKSGFMSWYFSNWCNFNILLWFLINLINDDAFVLAATANAYFMVHLVCLFMKTHLVALLQDSCLDLVRSGFLHKLFGCIRNITAFCQHLLRPIKSVILADTDISVEPKYRPIISARPIYRSISNFISWKTFLVHPYLTVPENAWGGSVTNR